MASKRRWQPREKLATDNERHSTQYPAGLVPGAGLGPDAAEIQFGGYTWTVRSGRGGPGPNAWDPRNLWLDSVTNLHLKISQRDGVWSCAEITMRQRLGFGRYQFQTIGRLDQLDDNVVLGLFNYPTGDLGPDGTHEIDIEFARWGNGANPIGNFTVWLAEKGLKHVTKSFPFPDASSENAAPGRGTTNYQPFQRRDQKLPRTLPFSSLVSPKPSPSSAP